MNNWLLLGATSLVAYWFVRKETIRRKAAGKEPERKHVPAFPVPLKKVVHPGLASDKAAYYPSATAPLPGEVQPSPTPSTWYTAHRDDGENVQRSLVNL